MTKLSGRGYSQYRHILVQLPDTGESRVSTIGKLVTERRHRELLLYMLLVSNWNWLSGRPEPLSAAVWVRALTSSKKQGTTWSAATLSRVWSRLEAIGLIEKRTRADRLVRVTPRREDAAEPYTAPAGRSDRWNSYFTLPDAFWNKEIFAELRLPGLALLLVIAKETSYQDEVWFTYDKMDEWYGLKARTVQNGVKELKELDLLATREEIVHAPLSPAGITRKTYYSLTGDFSRASRDAQKKTAQSAVHRRSAQTTKLSATQIS